MGDATGHDVVCFRAGGGGWARGVRWGGGTRQPWGAGVAGRMNVLDKLVVEGMEVATKKTPIRREGVGTRVVVPGTWEGKGWGKRSKTEDLNISRSSEFIYGVQYHRGRRRLLRVGPPTSPTYKYYQHHSSGGTITQAPGRPVSQSQGQLTRNWLEDGWEAGG